MSMSLIAIDSVLRKLVGGGPVPEGLRLYDSLASTGQVILLADGQADDKTYEWLQLHGLIKHAFVDWSTGSTRVAQANELRRQGYDIDLVVTPDPRSARELIEAGFNTLLFTHAQYTQPRWRPDTDPGVQPWDDITKQVADQARLKAADARIRRDDD